MFALTILLERQLVFALILALSLLLSPLQQPADPSWYGASDFPARGEVTYYAPGLMHWVYEYRIRQEQVPVCDPPKCIGYVATLRPGDLGRTVWLQSPGRFAEGPFLVVDYAAREDFDRLRQRGLVIEVDYETAQRWGMQGPLQDVLVLPESPYTQRVNLPLIDLAGSPASQTPTRSPEPRLWLPVIVSGRP